MEQEASNLHTTFFKKVVKQFEYHIDLHTASFGRSNSFYVRADMTDPVMAKMALLHHPEIILHSKGEGGDGGSGTIRGAAMEHGIKSICIEVGNPQTFQTEYINCTYAGLANVLNWLNMISIDPKELDSFKKFDTVICTSSFWAYTKRGGILMVLPPLASRVKKGDVIASIVDIFGFVVDQVASPCDGVVIGKSTNPSNLQGDRIVHLGVIVDPSAINADGSIDEK